MTRFLKPILGISLIVPIFQGIQHALIGSIYPMIIVGLVLSPVIYAVLRMKFPDSTIKYWGYLNLCYGATGLFLIAFGLSAGNGLPSAIYYQFNVWYVLKMGMCVFIGWLLLNIRKNLLTSIHG